MGHYTFLDACAMVASCTARQTIFSVIGLSARECFTVPGEQVGLGPHLAVVFAKCAEQFFTRGKFPIDVALSLYNTKHHTLAVHVSHLETAQLSAVQDARVEGDQHSAVVEIPSRANQVSDFIPSEDRWQKALFWISGSSFISCRLCTLLQTKRRAQMLRTTVLTANFRVPGRYAW